MKIRILNDYQYDGYEEYGLPIPVGTVIENAELCDTPWWVGAEATNPNPGQSARYPHPDTGSDWISYPGAYEIIE